MALKHRITLQHIIYILLLMQEFSPRTVDAFDHTKSDVPVAYSSYPAIHWLSYPVYVAGSGSAIQQYMAKVSRYI